MRILLIQDEEKVSRFVALGLSAEQFVVDCTKDGITGYEMATERPYDVLIVDLMLPRLSGSELISRLRQNQVETPILVLTARDQLDVAESFAASAAEPLALAEAQYRAGQTSIIELSQAELSETQSEIAAAAAKYDYEILRAALDFQVGTTQYETPKAGR